MKSVYCIVLQSPNIRLNLQNNGQYLNKNYVNEIGDVLASLIDVPTNPSKFANTFASNRQMC